MHAKEQIEIRLLGTLRVRRGDNSPVHASEWRTGKTLDLLRILALRAGLPERTDSLLEKLWPDVEESKGRASLRTAASQIRRTLGSDCIERQLGGLVLTNAWVDVAVFRNLATEARECHRSGHHAEVVCLSRQADALYVGDFGAHDGDSGWARESRESLAALRVSLLTDAVESAVELRWMRDAVDLATLVIDADPYSDRGHRGLMAAYAGLGETDRALRSYSDYRALLSDDLGIAPSAQCQALQMNLLAGAADHAPAPLWAGHEADCASVVSMLQEPAKDGVRVMCVIGSPGSGREAVVDAALERVGVTGVRLEPRPPRSLPSSTELAVAADRAPVVVLPTLDSCDDSDVAELVSTLAELRPSGSGAIVVVPVDERHTSLLLAELQMVPVETRVMALHALTPTELEHLAEKTLCGPPAPGLVNTLMRLSGGLSGRAITELRRWLADGTVLWTPLGLDLASPDAELSDLELELEIDATSRRMLERVSPLGLEVVTLMALLDRPGTAALVTRLLDRVVWTDVTEVDVDLALDELADLGVLRLGPHGYEFIRQRMRTTSEAWLRHGVRRRLHRHLAESPLLPEADGAAHWVKAAVPLSLVEPPSTGRQGRTGGDWPGREEGLTEREAEVLALITVGLSNLEIAHRTSLSVNSIKSYIHSCYRKIDVDRRSLAVRWGLAHGLCPDRVQGSLDQHAATSVSEINTAHRDRSISAMPVPQPA